MSKEWELIKNIYGCTTILMQEEEAKETKNAFEVIEKSLKALEILKKNFEFGLFETDKYKVYIYSSDDDYSVVKRISEEEFNLLKEVLE